jgi:PAS domain-containing protein
MIRVLSDCRRRSRDNLSLLTNPALYLRSMWELWEIIAPSVAAHSKRCRARTIGVFAAMGYELSRDVLRAAELSDDLRDSEERTSLAAEAANLGMWVWDVA